ncbi:sensor histidine kinase [Ornithinibacillus halophilus]|uniref:sensor histidine kinase n=1 Tax=Ornithinibacillus halophilus TaxID=930117 RepID=UPI001F2BBB0E|nr:ATP-binding protein [Ornithinibacillus halophilus]
MIPTGGISSPFIWYALNPILVAASFLTPLFCWGILILLLSSTTYIAYSMYQWNSFFQLIEESFSVFLVCILITILARLFSEYIQDLNQKANLLIKQQEDLNYSNEKLKETNQKYEETLEQIISLYHLMEKFVTEKSHRSLTSEVTNSLIKCTQSNEAFFWLTDPNHERSVLSNRTNNKELEEVLLKEWNQIRGKRQAFATILDKDLYWLKVVRTSKNIGVLGIRVINHQEMRDSYFLLQPFEFLAELSEIMLEQIHLEQMKDKMILIEEQNRIANEIHDSVSQRLFALVFALHSLQSRSNTITKEELTKESKVLTQSANTIIKELRSTIYRLSSVKKGEKPFIVQIKRYLEEYAHLNDIKIKQDITGNEALIENDVKKALYRIISEACGNSVRHGRCNLINIEMRLNKETVELLIQDDGIGIDVKKVIGNNGNGLGLVNMQRMVQSLSGQFSINGSKEKGTTINVEIPNIRAYKKQGVAIS